jgi:hypothetical protein
LASRRASLTQYGACEQQQKKKLLEKAYSKPVHQNRVDNVNSKLFASSNSSFWIARVQLNRKGPIGVAQNTVAPATWRSIAAL